MATAGGTPSNAGDFAASPGREILEISSDSGSDSSVLEPDSPNPFSRPCTWRTAEFHDQECSRYFDCPSHMVERALSDDEAEPRDARLSEGQGEHGQEEQVEADGGLARLHTTSSGIENPSAAWEQQIDAGPQVHHAGDHHSAVIDLTRSPEPEDQDVVMSSPPEDGGFDLEEVLEQNTQQVAMASTPPPPREVIDLTETETPPPPPPPPPPAQPAPAMLPSSSSQQRPPAFGSRPPLERAAHPSEVSLPRWQPDAETTLCPICRTQFSFFVRKHHCR